MGNQRVPPAPLAPGDRVQQTEPNRIGYVVSANCTKAWIEFTDRCSLVHKTKLFYLPTPEQIAAHCMRIKDGWTPLEEKNRRGLLRDDDEGVHLPSMTLGAFLKCVGARENNRFDLSVLDLAQNNGRGMNKTTPQS